MSEPNVRVELKTSFGIENLTVSDIDISPPGPSELLVRMRYASLNYLDLLLVEGAFDGEISFPHVPVCNGWVS